MKANNIAYRNLRAEMSRNDIGIGDMAKALSYNRDTLSRKLSRKSPITLEESFAIQPQWCELIVSGKKALEVRKTRPKLETPFKCYIYCTYGYGLIEHSDPCLPNMLIEQKVTKEKTWGNCCNGKVIGEFVCDWIDSITHEYGKLWCTTNTAFSGASCLSQNDIATYIGEDGRGYGWHISRLVIYDKPKELNEFMKPCGSDLYCESCAMFHQFEDRCGNKALMLSRPPQSWCYVEELKGGDDG